MTQSRARLSTDLVNERLANLLLGRFVGWREPESYGRLCLLVVVLVVLAHKSIEDSGSKTDSGATKYTG